MTPSPDRFDRWLERELRKDLDAVTQRPAPRRPRYAGRQAGSRRLVALFSGFSGAGAAVASKAALGFAVTAFAVGITGAAVETAVTGSPVPVPLEEQVAAAVQSISAPPAAPPTPAHEPAPGIQVIASARTETGGPTPPAPQGGHRTVTVALPPATPGQHREGSSDSQPAAEPSRRAEPEPSPSQSPGPKATPKPSPTPTPEHPGDRGGHGQVEAHTVRPSPTPDQEQDGQ